MPDWRATLILVVTVAYSLAGVVAFALWPITGIVDWVNHFFRVASAIVLVSMAAAQLCFSAQACDEFQPGEPMLVAWQLITASAAFDLAGALAIQVLGSDMALNPLIHLSGWSQPMVAAIKDVGFILGGTCRFLLLAAGLFCVLRLYRESGFLGRLHAVDWALLAACAAYCLSETADLIVAFQKGKHTNWAEALRWPVDPLLCLLLAEALLLHRSVQRTGGGLVGRCWRTFSTGISLILMGDVLLWAEQYGYLPWPWSSLSWYVWVPAAAAFAMGPVYQLEAIRLAGQARDHSA